MDDIVYQDQIQNVPKAQTIKQKILQLFNCRKAENNAEARYQRSSIHENAQIQQGKNSSWRQMTKTSYSDQDFMTGARASVAVVECPIPSLVADNRTSKTSVDSVGAYRPSIAIPITKNASVSALEVLPASPEKEKFIEIYAITKESVITAQKSGRFPYLVKFFEETERDALKLILSDNNFDCPAGMKCKVLNNVNSEYRERKCNKDVVSVFFEDGKNYLGEAVEKISKIKEHGKEQDKIIICSSNAVSSHNHHIVDDIRGITALFSVNSHEKSSFKKIHGVPIVQLDHNSVGHITIGFDEYQQFEIRRVEMLNYESYLEQLGLLDFIEADEEEYEEE